MISFEEVKAFAHRVGFDDAGACTPHLPDADKEALQQWLDEGMHGELSYMENPLRFNPDGVLPGAKTALIFVSYYKQEKLPFSEERGLIASYARGRDYHRVHQKRLKKVIAYLEERSGKSEIARSFSDAFPIMEKALAVKAGLGWFGKNTLLIHKKFGTFTLLSGILTTLEVEIPLTDPMRLAKCGSCTKCLDACPTGALVSPYTLDAKLCLSYHLIESKKAVPDEIGKKNPGYIFGCDICQDVCPHNVRKAPSLHEEFLPTSGMGAYLGFEELKLLEETPERLFGTPLQRRKVQGLKENLKSGVKS